MQSHDVRAFANSDARFARALIRVLGLHVELILVTAGVFGKSIKNLLVALQLSRAPRQRNVDLLDMASNMRPDLRRTPIR